MCYWASCSCLLLDFCIEIRTLDAVVIVSRSRKHYCVLNLLNQSNLMEYHQFLNGLFDPAKNPKYRSIMRCCSIYRILLLNALKLFSFINLHLPQ